MKADQFKYVTKMSAGKDVCFFQNIRAMLDIISNIDLIFWTTTTTKNIWI